MSGNAPANQLQLGFELLDRVKPDRGVRSGETLIGGERIEHPAQCWAQRTEPPYADPHVRWCGRGERVTAPPMPILIANRVRQRRSKKTFAAVTGDTGRGPHRSADALENWPRP